MLFVPVAVLVLFFLFGLFMCEMCSAGDMPLNVQIMRVISGNAVGRNWDVV